MKYTIWQKVKSFLYNLARTRLSEYKYFIPLKNKVDSFLWDLTKEEDYDSRDWTLDWSEELPKIEREVKYMIDQSLEWRTRNSCVPASILLSLYHNANIKPSHKEFKEFLNYLESVWHWREESWASAPKVVVSVVKRWNELYPNNKMQYRRVAYWSAGYTELFKKWYALAGWYNTFPEYAQDLSDDWRVNKKRYSDSKRRGWHYVWVMYWEILKKLSFTEITSSWEIKRSYDIDYNLENVVNQYPSRHKSHNVYSHEVMSSHTQNWYWYSWFYAILPLEVLEVTKPTPTAIPTVWDLKKSYDDLVRENNILRRRADESEALQKQSLKKLKPNDY